MKHAFLIANKEKYRQQKGIKNREKKKERKGKKRVTKEENWLREHFSFLIWLQENTAQ